MLLLRGKVCVLFNFSTKEEKRTGDNWLHLTRVELTQENIPEEENPEKNLYLAYSQGWAFYMVNLKSILEGGIDLRNKNDLLSKVVNS
jgi:hypothetical protein